VTDQEFLSDVVRFDLPRLGDISGLRGVHLQCHIGTDTLSLARLGARMSGLDFSPAAIEQAETLAARTGVEVDFHVADVYDAVEVLGEASYDLVFTGIGALCWLPNVERWAQTVAGLLRPRRTAPVSGGSPIGRSGSRRRTRCKPGDATEARRQATRGMAGPRVSERGAAELSGTSPWPCAGSPACSAHAARPAQAWRQLRL
jgi:SAM-dependent methyltransferase